ncbi:MAG: GH92 family glycosyl hydrolase [Chitinophagaceae bacterium]
MIKKIIVLTLLHLFAILPFVYTQQKQPVELVYPLLDAANSRWFYFSSASRPFGMVSLFPDNVIANDWGGGYRYAIDTIRDFSHIHEWQLSGVSVMPVTGDPLNNNSLAEIFRNHDSFFSHQKETVRPGYHSVFLERYKEKVELTATSHAGFHRYQFPSSKNKAVLFELSGGLLGPSKMIEGDFEKVSDHEIRGYLVNGPTNRRPKTYTVYFSAVFNQPIKTIYLNEGSVIKNNVSKWSGKNGSIIVELADNSSKQLMMKVGISYTSKEAAANNLSKEINKWEFDKIVKDASDQWNGMLSRIKIEGGSLQEQQRFYTDLWHSIQGRRIITDVDGKYADFTGAERTIKQVPLTANGKPQFNMFNSDSFWGAEFTLNTLWQLVYPEIAEEFCQSFLEYYRNGGLIPRGPAGGNYTNVMTGAQLTPFYVAAWQKGIKGFDINRAYEGLKKNHMPGGMMAKAGYEHKTARGGGLEYYMDKGYVPYPLSDTVFGFHQDGAAITLQNAYQDWCLAQLAKALDHKEDYEYFLKRSTNYKSLYNPTAGYMVPKNKQGEWRAKYDPLEYEHGFEEGNGAQYSWYVPHDLEGLFMLMGGKDKAIAKLDSAFRQSQPSRFSDEHPEFTARNNRRIMINYSNQPSIQTVFIFNRAGAPWLTQYWSRMVIDSAYSALSPFYGYNGDEDQGLMGSLSVLMKMGIFQMTGGCEADPVYEIGSPVFKKITITLNSKYYKANNFIIEANDNSAKNIYVKNISVNGKPRQEYNFHHSDINKGLRLELDMTDLPGGGKAF